MMAGQHPCPCILFRFLFAPSYTRCRGWGGGGGTLEEETAHAAAKKKKKKKKKKNASIQFPVRKKLPRYRVAAIFALRRFDRETALPSPSLIEFSTDGH